jgi:hypothetical protein
MERRYGHERMVNRSNAGSAQMQTCHSILPLFLSPTTAVPVVMTAPGYHVYLTV